METTTKVKRATIIRSQFVYEDAPAYLGGSMRSPARVAGVLRPIIGDPCEEVFMALVLDGKHRLRGIQEVSRGTLTTSLVHPREVFFAAVSMKAAAVIVAHNHPSGDPEPSIEDLEVTRRLVEAGRILGIPLLDHVVLGDDERFVSLRDRMDCFS